jgi:hypothetical protein
MKFKMDKTVFSAEKMSAQKKEKAYWLSLPVGERFRVAMYLQSIAWKFGLNNPPLMDKTAFFAGKQKDLDDIEQIS